MTSDGISHLKARHFAFVDVDPTLELMAVPAGPSPLAGARLAPANAGVETHWPRLVNADTIGVSDGVVALPGSSLPFTARFLALAVKRTLDVTISAVGLLVLAPIFVIVAVVVRLDSKGPSIFRTRMLGLNGRPFIMWKLRTMTEDAEELERKCVESDERWGFTIKTPDDPRITRAGRWLRRLSIDEFPQLVNVLRGDMSIVGPRPLKRYEVESNSELAVRFQMRPGITGLWQVSGRNSVTPAKRAQLDLAYVRDWGLLLDLRILLLSVPAVLSGRGAF